MKRIRTVLGMTVMGLALLVTGCGDGGSKSAVKSGTSEPVAAATMTPKATSTPTAAPTSTPTPEVEEKMLPKLVEAKVPDTSAVDEEYKSAGGIEQLITQVGKDKTQPAINITTEGKAKINSKDEYVAAVIDVFNCDEQYRLTATGGVKVRGNSTSKDEPKPYRIKFDNKQTMLGLNEGQSYKSWVLLKPYWNLCPDLLAFTIFSVVSEGQYYCSDSTFVNVYVNGSYKGVYMLCEQNQTGEGRVEITEPGKEDDTLEIGYFLEMDNYPGEDHHYFTLDYGKRKLEDFQGTERVAPEDHISVKSNIYTTAQLKQINTYIENVYEIMYFACVQNEAYEIDENGQLVKSSLTPREAFEKVIDVKSLVSILIVEELMQNYDVGAGSFYMAVDFSEASKFEKLTFLAPWDFNWAGYEPANKNFYAGTWQKIMDDKYDRSNIWLITAMKADWFRELVKDEVEKISSDGSFEEAIKGVEDYIETLRPDFGGDGWKVDCGKDYCRYCRTRLKYLKENL